MLNIWGYFINLLRKNRSLRNPPIWLAESILAYISETRFFPNVGFAQENIFFHYRINSVKINDQIFLQIQKTLFLAFFWSMYNPPPPHPPSYDTVPWKIPERWKNGRTDRRTDRLYFKRLFPLLLEVQKGENFESLMKIAVVNESSYIILHTCYEDT